jgi:chemotaxis protein histidine kinase CheA
LSIVAATVNALGGTVALNTAQGQGTTVRVELPLSTGRLDQLPPAPSLSAT